MFKKGLFKRLFLLYNIAKKERKIMNTNRLGVFCCVKEKDGSSTYVFNVYERLGKNKDGKEILKELGQDESKSFEELFGCNKGELEFLKKYVTKGLTMITFHNGDEVVSRLRYLGANLGDGFGKDVVESARDLERFISSNEDVFARNVAKIEVLGEIASTFGDGME